MEKLFKKSDRKMEWCILNTIKKNQISFNTFSTIIWLFLEQMHLQKEYFQ